MDENTRQERARRVVRSYQVRRPPVPAIDFGTGDGLPLKRHHDRARAFLDPSRPPPAEMSCGNTRHHRLSGKRSHKEVTGSSSNKAAFDRFVEPWHLFCADCQEEARRTGWNATPRSTAETVQQAATEAAEAGAEAHAAANRGQQFASTSALRRAIEWHAMGLAQAHFRALDYEVEDRSASEPYDLLASKPGERLFIEVKGTTTAGEEVFLTRNEVEHARAHPDHTVLFVVHGVTVEEGPDGEPQASAGTPKLLWPWSPSDDRLVPISFRYAVPTVEP